MFNESEIIPHSNLLHSGPYRGDYHLGSKSDFGVSVDLSEASPCKFKSLLETVDLHLVQVGEWLAPRILNLYRKAGRIQFTGIVVKISFCATLRLFVTIGLRRYVPIPIRRRCPSLLIRCYFGEFSMKLTLSSKVD